VSYARSKHPGGVNACLGDGSVRFISNGINPTAWLYMGSTADGQVVSLES
jgi:prepilin-type processing-associated H-X9-DG protein